MNPSVFAHQRPKLERYDEALFLVLKTLNYVPHESTLLAREIVETGEIMVFRQPRLRGDGSARRSLRGQPRCRRPTLRSFMFGPRC